VAGLGQAGVAERLRAGLGELADSGAVPSAAYAVVSDGAVIADGFGEAGPRTVFQVGSVTKAVTGLLLGDMVQRGEVALSDPATRYLAGATPGNITLLDLATHTSGLLSVPPRMWGARLHPADPYRGYSADRLARAARRSLAGRLGARPYRYSNYGFGLLGYLLGQAAGTPYEALVAERICGPLGLTETGFRGHPVQGYSRGRPVPPWDMAALAAAGGLFSTAADLARLLAAALTPDQTPLGPAIRIALEPRRPIAPGADMGLGWHHLARGGDQLTWHNGMTGGYTAVVALSPARRTGAVALANTGGAPPSPLDAVVFDALSGS
jgi:CubicO group peptidase (beta-lactamase class C family)